MQASFYTNVRKSIFMNFPIRGSSAWWSRTRMVRVTTALDIQVSLRNQMANFISGLSSNMVASGNPLYQVSQKKRNGGFTSLDKASSAEENDT